MVYQIVQTKAKVIVEALAVTFVIFLVGIAVGLYAENSRTDKIIDVYEKNEVEALDLKLQNYYFQIMDAAACDEAIEENFIFADDIYEIGLRLERYEEANQLSDKLFLQKQKYSLLKTELWLNSLVLKKRCNDPFDTVVYLYQGDPQSSTVLAQQKVLSNTLKEVKERNGNTIILLPIVGDAGLRSVAMQKRVYNITSLPVILINERNALYGYQSVGKIESFLDNRNESNY